MSKRLAKLYRPCDKLDKYDNEPYMKNPLLHIRLSEIRQRRHYSYLQKKAVEVFFIVINHFLHYRFFFLIRTFLNERNRKSSDFHYKLFQILGKGKIM